MVPRSLGSSRTRRRHASQFASNMCQPGQGSFSAGTYSSLYPKSTVTFTATSLSAAFLGQSTASSPAAKRARHSHPSACATALQQAPQKITRFTQVGSVAGSGTPPRCINCRGMKHLKRQPSCHQIKSRSTVWQRNRARHGTTSQGGCHDEEDIRISMATCKLIIKEPFKQLKRIGGN
ncbi:GL14187 [Drosophila persimilis]|uniref:GL14187 n=1 Tax=Drosophila persimilis TaxID=7234 RepID=B4GTY0_DROPE|nr:GL14187 [Drosophila persimilis]